MFALVVLRAKPLTYCIVPEEYIYGLDEIEDQLKTWGVSKSDHLVFWTRSLIDDVTAPNTVIVPNFNLDPCQEYPPPPEIHSTCYLGRVKRFFSECDYYFIVPSA